MRWLRIVALFAFLSFSCRSSFAQTIPINRDRPAQVFTLQQAIDYALQNGFPRKTLGLSLEAARQNLQASKGAFKTNADIQFDLPNLAENVSALQIPGELPVYNTTGTLRYRGLLSINQPLPTNGVFTLASELYQQDRSVSLATGESQQKQREFLNSVSLRFRQPLFTINTLKLGYKEANLNYDRTRGQIRRTELDVVYNVTQDFYSLYRTTRELEIAQEEMQQQQDAFNLASKKYESGLIPEVEALQAEVDLAQSKNRVYTAESALRRAEDVLKQTIGMPLPAHLVVQTTVEYKPFAIDLDKAIAYGVANRSELRELEIDRQLQEITLKRVDARSEFKGELSAYYDLTGVSVGAIDARTGTLFNDSWQNLQDRPKNKGIVFSVSMPLWDSGVNGSEVAAARARLDQSELNLANQRVTVEREIKDVVSRVREAQERLVVLEKSQKVAERSYEISLARFDNGDITTQALALDRDRLTQARSAYLTAYIDYQTAIADLKRKTLYDFENNRSLVEE